MITFHQALVAASPGDAITSLSYEIRDLLRTIGPSDIFAWYIDKSLTGDIVPMQVYDEWISDRKYDPVLLYHASIGSPEVLSFMLDRREPLVLIYHNISPAEPFLPYDPAFAGKLAEGRRELLQLKDKFVLAIADSTFNASDLEVLGFNRITVVPPIVDYEGLIATEDDPEAVETISNDAPIILYVGQLLPHKRPDLAIQAFHILRTYLKQDVRLVLVGHSRLPAYERALKTFIDELNIDGVDFVGQVSHEVLATYYRHSHLFLTLSEHEGFCFPLVESMAFGLPIVTRAFGAIPETLGRGGLLLSEEDSPAMAAEAIHAVLEDPSMRSMLIQAATERLAAFQPVRARASLIQELIKVV